MGNYTAIYDTEDITELTTSGLGEGVLVVVSLIGLITLIALGTWMFMRGKKVVKM